MPLIQHTLGMKSIAVFCGSREGYNPVHREQAYRLGGLLAEKDIHLVYGAAKVGLMGAVADGVLNNNGSVTGVIPHFLEQKEIVHEGLSELILVNTMHERKLKMYDRSDAFMVLPGGWGTMEEMFEILTWGQLGMHEKPIGVLNINGYYDPLKAQNTMMVQEGFLSERIREILKFSPSAEDLLEWMEDYSAPETQQVINKQTT